MMGTKYRLSFYTDKGDLCSVNFQQDGYSGVITELTGGVTPLVIKADCDNDNIYDPIISSSATISLFLDGDEPIDMFSEFATVQDREIWVECVLPNFKWYGWLIADQNQRTFFDKGYEMTVKAMDVFSVMKTQSLFNIYKQEFITDGKFCTIRDIIYTCFKNAFPTDFDVNIAYNLSLNISDGVSERFWFDATLMINSLCETDSMMLAYDFIEKTMKSVKMIILVHNGTAYITSPMARANGYARYVVFKNNDASNISTELFSDDTQIGILGSEDLYPISNNESITLSQAIKEYGSKVENPDIDNLIHNPFLSTNNNDNISAWGKNVHGTYLTSMTSMGDGHRWNPYRNRLQSNKTLFGNSFDRANFYLSNPYLWQVTDDKMPYRTPFKVTIKMIIGTVGQDASLFVPPDIPIYIFLGDRKDPYSYEHRDPVFGYYDRDLVVGWAGYQYGWVSWNDLSSTAKNNLAYGQILNPMYGISGSFTAGEPFEFTINVDARIPDENSSDYWGSGYLHISFMPMWYRYKYPNMFDFYDIISVKVEADAEDVGYLQAQSITTYKIQSKDYTKSEDPEDTPFTNRIKKFDYGWQYTDSTNPYILFDRVRKNALKFDSTTEIKWFSFNNRSYNYLTEWTAENGIYFNRNSLTKTQLDISASGLSPLKLIVYKTEGYEILKNKHLLQSYEYNVKTCEVSEMNTIELNGSINDDDITQNILEMNSVDLSRTT